MSRTYSQLRPNPAPFKGRTCLDCGRPLKGYHQRLYCDNACKQHAYRDRGKNATQAAIRLESRSKGKRKRSATGSPGNADDLRRASSLTKTAFELVEPIPPAKSKFGNEHGRSHRKAASHA